MRTVIYARVSTQHQDYARQLADLKAFAERNGIQILKIFEEKISSMKLREQRRQLKAMIEFIEANHVQKVLCWELSRLGRDTIDTLTMIGKFTSMKVSTHIYNLNLETLTPSGEVNLMAKFMMTILAEVASMERVQLVQRLKSGYQHHRSQGGRVGRRKGYKKPVESLKQGHSDIIKLLKKGLSMRQIAAITGKSKNTVVKVRRVM